MGRSDSARRDRWRRRFAYAAVLASLVVAYPGLVTGSKVPVSDDVIISDLLDAEVPARVAAARKLGVGPGRDWIPEALSKSEPAGAVLFAALPPAKALDWYVLLLLATFGLGTAALAEKLGASALGTAFAGIVAANSGFAVCQLQHLSELGSVAPFPWALLSLEGALARLRGGERARAGAFLAGFGLVFGEQVLAGFPQTTFYAALAYGAWVVARLATEPGSRRDRALFFLAFVLAGLAGAAVGAVSLWPMAELARASNRAHPLTLDFIAQWPFPARDLLSLLWPFPAGDPSRGTYHLAAAFGEDYGYLGILAVPLSLLALTSRPRRSTALLLWGCAIVALLFALGTSTPLFPLAFHVVPGMKLFRFPQRFLFVTETCLALVGALGLTRAAELFGALHDAGRLRFNPAMLSAALLVAASADVLLANTPLNTLDAASHWLSPPSTVAHLPAERPLRVYTPKWVQLHRTARRVAQGWTRRDLKPYLALRKLLPPNVGLLWGIEPADPYGGLSNEGNAEIFGDQFGPGLINQTFAMPTLEDLSGDRTFHRLLAMDAVQFVLSPAGVHAPGFTLVFQEPGVRVYRVDDALPRVHLVPDATYAADDRDAGEKLLDDSFDPRREVVLVGHGDAAERRGTGVLAHGASRMGGATAPPIERPSPRNDGLRSASPILRFGSPAPARAAARLVSVQRLARGLVARTAGAQPAWLVVAEAWLPSTEAEVDGRRVRIVRANVNQEAVRVPAGPHVVRIFDALRAEKKGAVVSGLALFALLAVVVLGLALGRRPRPARRA